MKLKHFKLPTLTRKKIALIIFIAFLGGVIAEIWAVNRLSTYGEQIVKLEQASSALSLENQGLENTIAEKSSISQVKERSSTLGFKSISKVQYLQPTEVALNQ